MVEVYRRDDGGCGARNHVGRIEAATQAHFEDDCIRLVAREGEHGGSGGDLEKGDGSASVLFFAFLQKGCEFVLVDQFATEADALVKAHKVGR